MKVTAVRAVEAGQPADVCFGKVISISPLKIMVEQKIVLSAGQLVLSRNVTDHTVAVSMNWTTESAGNHNHPYIDDSSSRTTDLAGTHIHQIISSKGKTITIHNALVVSDEVILLKKKGGQKYIVLDRVVNL
jgi:hypothetical protein